MMWLYCQGEDKVTTKQEKLKEFIEGVPPGNVPPEGGTEQKSETQPVDTQGAALEKHTSTPQFELKKPGFFEHVHVGSLGLATVFLLVMLWLLVPTSSGKTRMELLWLTLFGETKLVTDTGTPGTEGSQGGSDQQGQSKTPHGGPETGLPGIDFTSMEMGF